MLFGGLPKATYVMKRVEDQYFRSLGYVYSADNVSQIMNLKAINRYI